MRILRHIPAALARLATACASLVLAAWLAGRVLTDTYAWSQWLWWLPTVAAAAAAVLGFCISLVPRPGRRSRAMAWSVVLAAVLAYFALVEQRLPCRTPRGQPALRLVHWNVPTGSLVDADVCAEALLAEGGDVIVASNAPFIGRRPSIRAWLGDDAQPQRLGVFLILTRLPIVRTEILANDEEFCLATVRLDTEAALGRPLDLLLVDLPSSPRLRRMAIAERVRAAIDGAEAEYDLVVGDFNIPRGSRSIRHMFPSHRHAFDVAGCGYGASFRRGDWLLYHLDHVLLAPTVRAMRYRLVDPGLGRHMMQVVDLPPGG